jgi:hypothetical protein
MRLTILRGLFAVIVALTAVPDAPACTIPVFRYALERWDLSAYELLVFHRGDLPNPGRAFLDALPNRANIAVRFVDLEGELSPAHRKLWEAQAKATAPWAILRWPDGDKRPAVWSGPLNVARLEKLVDSPARQRIVKGLANGDSAVFVLLECGDAEADEAARKLLERELVKLPEQSQSGPRIRLALPLKVSMPVMTLKRDDPAEDGFVRLLLASEDEVAEAVGPIVFPIFGRGRLLGAGWGDAIKADTFYGVVSFLCGECSCEVKQANPGSDLLIAADWPAIFNRIGPAPETGPEMPMGVTRLARAKPLAGLLAIAPGATKMGNGLETEVRVSFSHEPQKATPITTPTHEAPADQPCHCWLWGAILVVGLLVVGTGAWAGVQWLRNRPPRI